jgi:hypothetical protein
MEWDRNLAQTCRTQNRRWAKSQIHLDIFGSDMQCHITFPYFISKFLNLERHVNVNSSLHLILRALLGVLCNKYNTYNRTLPITESRRTVFRRLVLNLRYGGPFCSIIRNNTDAIPRYTHFIKIPMQLHVSPTWSSHHQAVCIRKCKKEHYKAVATHNLKLHGQDLTHVLPGTDHEGPDGE